MPELHHILCASSIRASPIDPAVFDPCKSEAFVAERPDGLCSGPKHASHKIGGHVFTGLKSEANCVVASWQRSIGDSTQLGNREAGPKDAKVDQQQRTRLCYQSRQIEFLLTSLGTTAVYI